MNFKLNATPMASHLTMSLNDSIGEGAEGEPGETVTSTLSLKRISSVCKDKYIPIAENSR